MEVTNLSYLAKVCNFHCSGVSDSPIVKSEHTCIGEWIGAFVLYLHDYAWRDWRLSSGERFESINLVISTAPTHTMSFIVYLYSIKVYTITSNTIVVPMQHVEFTPSVGSVLCSYSIAMYGYR